MAVILHGCLENDGNRFESAVINKQSETFLTDFPASEFGMTVFLASKRSNRIVAVNRFKSLESDYLL